MCGIVGILTFDKSAGQPDFVQSVKEMTDLLQRRGPDDEGFWSDPNGHLQLGFRRLAVLDPSSAGHQPMISRDGQSAIVFNGEIYNFLELRSELEAQGIHFRSRTDTEILLEALNLWGEKAIPKLNGMFAFAWYSLKDHRLILARDHAGIKPLYYFLHSGKKGIAFASQFNALLHTPWGEPGALRRDVLRLYLKLHHIPPPYGLLENTYQLEPGHYLSVEANGEIHKQTWWTLPRRSEPDLKGAESLDILHESLDRAIRRQRIADVPLGVFLSGGVDSPLVTAIAQGQDDAQLKAFTIANPGWWQDEGESAASYARHLKVNHRMHAVSGEEALSAIPDVIKAQHEPFADFSILPTLLISRFARKEVTVALSGDGGDELFFGYERPLSLLQNGNDFRFPRLIRMALYGAGKFGLMSKKSSAIVSKTPGHYYFSVNSRISDDDMNQLAPELSSLPQDFDLYQFPKYENVKQLADYSRWVEFYGQLQRGLKKVDMASMHYSLEVRVPMLDREVIEASLRVDPFECMRNGTRKAVLRDLLTRYVPETLIPKPKRGFAVPLGEWLKNGLREVMEETLFSRNLFLNGFFQKKALRQYVDQHLSGQRDHKWGIWTLLSLQWWAKEHLKANSPIHV